MKINLFLIVRVKQIHRTIDQKKGEGDTIIAQDNNL